MLGSIVVIPGALIAWARWWPMRPLFEAPCSTVLLDRDGQLLEATVAVDGQWRFPPPENVPARFTACLVQFEDRHFFSHLGIRPRSLVRAWRQNRRAGRIVSGGSTLTMQVARLSRGPHDRTYGEKLIEALLALRIELRYSKADILRLFAAHAPFGGNVVGLDAAAWRYYGRPADRLSWSECATLAVLPNAPSAIHPGKRHAALRAKRDRLLDRLLEVKLIDRTEWSLAKEEPLPGRPKALPRRAPHLLTTMMTGGYAGELIRTTIDGHLQDRATAAVDRYAPVLEANEVHNAAALILDVRHGNVLAYVGNLSGAGPGHAGQVDIVRARRSTGSVLKPFLYADMLQDGELLPDMLVADVPTRYDGFAPRNYDEHYSGAVPASEALSRSLNVPAVRALHGHGVERTLCLLRAMGLKSIDRSANDYGLTLIVGGAESTLWELAGAYASMGRVLDNFGRGGLPYHAGDIHAPVLLPGQEGRSDGNSTTVDRRDPSPVLSAAAIWFTMKALREVARPAEEQGWNRFMGQQHIAWKTGTSYGHRDAWAIGLTDRYCVAVWTGNASGEGRPGLTGTLAAAPLLFDLFNLLPSGRGFDPPYDEMARTAVCPASGSRAGRDCPQADTLWVPREGLRTPTCPFHERILLDPTGHRISEGQGRSVPWFVLPPAMALYYAQRTPSYRALPPWQPGRTGLEDMPMEVLYPDNRSKVLVPVELDGGRGNMVVEVAHRDRDATVYWDLDGNYLGATVGEHRMALSPADGSHLLTLTDDAGHILRRSFTVVNGARNASAPNAP
jgi:penicillin-binding protein 1C